MAFSRRLELKTMQRMLQIYCSGQHRTAAAELCADCRQLLKYAGQRLDKCPFGEDKPVCSQCPVHCYQPDVREQVKRVMRYSGPKMLARSSILTVRYMYRKKFRSTP
jgi:hypothetical protein